MISLRSDNRGVVVGLIVMIASIICVALLYIVSMPAVGMIWDVISPGLPSRATPTMNLLNNVCGWTLLVLVIGTLLYGAALAFKRDPVDLVG